MIKQFAIKSGKPMKDEALWGDSENSLKMNLELLSEADRKIAEKFYTNGYLKIEQCVSNDACDKAIKAYDVWCEVHASKKAGIRQDSRNPRVVNLHSEIEEIKDLFVASPELLHTLDVMFGYRASVYTSLTFQFGTEQPLHRDTPVFRTEPKEFYFGVWIALEDATLDNGCLMVLEGGHRGGIVDPFSFAEAQFGANLSELSVSGNELWSCYQDAVVAKCLEDGAQKKLITAKKGDVIVWHPQLPHGGSPINDASKTRHSVVFHVVPERTPVYQAKEFFLREFSSPSLSWARTYEEYKNRLFMHTGGADFGSN